MLESLMTSKVALAFWDSASAMSRTASSCQAPPVMLEKPQRLHSNQRLRGVMATEKWSLASRKHPSFCWQKRYQSCLPHSYREVGTFETGCEPSQQDDMSHLLAAAVGLNCSLKNMFNICVLRSHLCLTVVTAQLHLTEMWWLWVYDSMGSDLMVQEKGHRAA